jgi:O-succinylbenzoic acid--CoA ligase
MSPWPICPVRFHAQGRPDAEALVSEGARWSWSQLDARVTALVAVLVASGIAPGDCVALEKLSAVELVVHLLALMRIGARALLLNSRLTPIEVSTQLERLRPRRVISAAVEASGPDAPGGGRSSRRTALPPPHREGTVHPSAGALLFTSGTTGVAKAALLRHRSLMAAARASALRLLTGSGSRWLCALPPYHVGGVAMLFRCLYDGSALVLHDRFDGARVVEVLRAERITHVSLVATMLQRVLRHGVPHLPALQTVLLGGGPTPARWVLEARASGLPVLLTYGLTEACSQVTTQRTPMGLDAGAPLDGLEVRIASDGEIEVRGPTLMLCYLYDERATQAACSGGWLKTGDFGSLDSEGRLTVLGRRHDLLISGGENVYPAEIEAALLQHPEVRDAGVLALDDAHWGQVPCALVVTGSSTLDERALREWCRGRLASYKVPARFRAVAALPKNAMGKLDRRALAALAALPKEAPT